MNNTVTDFVVTVFGIKAAYDHLYGVVSGLAVAETDPAKKQSLEDALKKAESMRK